MLLTLLPLLCPTPAPLDTPGVNLRISVSSLGQQGDESSGSGLYRQLQVTEDGRYTVFTSLAENLVPDDTNGFKDVFLRDALLETTYCVSRGSFGQQANGRCDTVGVSADGRFVVYMSEASNLVPFDFNDRKDVFLYDSQLGTSQLVSSSMSGGSANNNSESPCITADGNLVCFWSAASDIVPGDTNGVGDIFLWSRTTGGVSRASTDQFGGQTSGVSLSPMIARDGRYVVFASQDGELDFPDNNGHLDVFRKDLFTGGIKMARGAQQFNGTTTRPTVSEGGRYVSFESEGSNVVPGDTNGNNDVFLWDAAFGGFQLVSRGQGGVAANDASRRSRISGDGLWITYESEASNLVAGDTNGDSDIFVFQRESEWTERVSVGADGGQVNSYSFGPDLSQDGRFVVFFGWGAHVPGDTNGVYDVYRRDRQLSSQNLGFSYCQSNANSSGKPATMRVQQSPVIADNNLLIAIEDLPTSQPGYLLMSANQGFVPLFGGGFGNLCLSAPILRFDQDVLVTGAGSVEFAPDLTALPQGVTVLPGESWNFQFWFRDALPGPTSNTSDGLCVLLR